MDGVLKKIDFRRKIRLSKIWSFSTLSGLCGHKGNSVPTPIAGMRQLSLLEQDSKSGTHAFDPAETLRAHSSAGLFLPVSGRNWSRSKIIQCHCGLAYSSSASRASCQLNVVASARNESAGGWGENVAARTMVISRRLDNGPDRFRQPTLRVVIE